MATLSLISVNDDIFEWIGSDNERIVTKNGRIIETSGLKHNSKILNLHQVKIEPGIENELLISLFEPSATISQSILLIDLGEEILMMEKNYSSRVYQEVFKTNSYRWSGSNYYWFDSKTNLPIKTTTFTHPLLDVIEIEFYYKYD